eukprot:544550-Lingulodinium_polyedra.AAC.1
MPSTILLFRNASTMRSRGTDKARASFHLDDRHLSACPGALALVDRQFHARRALVAGVQEARTDP